MVVAVPTFEYGARFSMPTGKPAWTYFMTEDEFLRELLLAQMETGDLRKALESVKKKVQQEVRKRT